MASAANGFCSDSMYYVTRVGEGKVPHGALHLNALAMELFSRLI